jgi:hypothetical protein
LESPKEFGPSSILFLEVVVPWLNNPKRPACPNGLSHLLVRPQGTIRENPTDLFANSALESAAEVAGSFSSLFAILPLEAFFIIL